MYTSVEPELSNQQQKILFELQTLSLFLGEMPTLSQICSVLKISSKRLDCELEQMMDIGIIEATNENPDGFRLTRNSTIEIRGELSYRIPLVGEKTSKLRRDHRRQLRNEYVDRTKLSPIGLHFAMEVNEDCDDFHEYSHSWACGSYYIARQQSIAKDGNKVVALHNDELLVRRLAMSGEYPELVSKKHPTIKIGKDASFRILGVVIRCCRHLC